MFVQLRDYPMLDDAFDDALSDLDSAGHQLATSDLKIEDDQDFGFVTANLERDFGAEMRTGLEQRWLHAEAKIRLMRATETPDQRRKRQIAHLRGLLEIIAERHGFAL